jgi:hypothetical protein
MLSRAAVSRLHQASGKARENCRLNRHDGFARGLFLGHSESIVTPIFSSMICAELYTLVFSAKTKAPGRRTPLNKVPYEPNLLDCRRAVHGARVDCRGFADQHRHGLALRD